VLKDQIALDALLSSIPDLNITELNPKGNCCGAAGDYMLSHAADAKKLRQPILDNANAQSLDAVISSNVGCAMHIAEGLDKSSIPVIHPIILLAQQLEPLAQER
jgi:glycolate oxidase iron-sulfur subunit